MWRRKFLCAGVNCQRATSLGTKPAGVTTLQNHRQTGIVTSTERERERKSTKGEARLEEEDGKKEKISVKYGFRKLEWRSHTARAKWLNGRERKLFMKLSVVQPNLNSALREETERRKLDRKASRGVGQRAKWGEGQREMKSEKRERVIKREGKSEE